MTTATFLQDDSHFVVGIDGHAGYNANGPDIVCAACSTLTYTMLQSLLALDECKVTFSQDKAIGMFHADIIASDDTRERVEIILHVIMSGFALLQDKYPDNVRLRISGEK